MTGEIDSGMYIIGTSVEADIKIIEVREVLRADINTKKIFDNIEDANKKLEYLHKCGYKDLIVANIVKHLEEDLIGYAQQKQKCEVYIIPKS